MFELYCVGKKTYLLTVVRLPVCVYFLVTRLPYGLGTNNIILQLKCTL